MNRLNLLPVYLIFYSSLVHSNPLFLGAIRSGDVTEARKLIQQKENVNQKTMCGDSMLMYAKSEDMVKLLISSGANVNELDANGYSFLMLLDDSPKIAELLIKNKANLEISNSFGQNALHLAVKRGNTNLVKVLSKYKNLDVPDSNGNTPLLYAVEKSSIEMTNILLANKSNPNILGSIGTALHISIKNGDIEIIKSLLKSKANKNLKDEYGFTASMEAERSGNLEIQKLFLN